MSQAGHVPDCTYLSPDRFSTSMCSLLCTRIYQLIEKTEIIKIWITCDLCTNPLVLVCLIGKLDFVSRCEWVCSVFAF